MKPDAKIFDDLSRVAGGALNVFSAFREQILNDIKTRVDEAAERMNLVPREDFDRLEARVNALQKKLESMGGDKKSPAATKAAPKKTAPKKPAVKKGKKKV
jgi:BMFP domain-containing protein YqiC